MTQEVFVNVGESTLAVAALSTDATLTLLSGAPFPATGTYRIRLDDSLQQPGGIATRYEINRATFNAGNVINGFRTGVDLEGTTSQGWPIGTAVRAIVTAAALSTFVQLSFANYKAKARNSSNTVYVSTATKIALTSVDYDPNSNFASSRYTVAVPGYYDIRAKLACYGTTAAGEADCMIYKNGAELDRCVAVAYTAPATQVLTGIYPLAVGDYIELYGSYSAGISANSWAAAAAFSSLTVAYCSAL